MIRKSRLLASAAAIALAYSPARADLESRQPILGGKIWGDLGFIENRGQVEEGVRFYLREGLRTTWITNDGLTYTLRRKISDRAEQSVAGVPLRPGFEETAVSISFVSPSSSRRLSATGNRGVPISLIGSAGSVTTSSFERLVYEDAWNGVDFHFHRNDGELEGAITVEPGTDPKVILLRVSGHERLEISNSGSLSIHTKLSPLELDAPFAHQLIGDRLVEVGVRFRTNGESSYGFVLGEYDETAPLVIDLNGHPSLPEGSPSRSS